MYFHWLFRLGLVGLVTSIACSGKWIWAVWLIALAAYFTVQRTADRIGPPDIVRMVFADAVLMQLVLAVAAALLSGAAGAVLLTVGITLNYIAIACNGWRMPMFGAYSSNPCYVHGDENTPVVWLSDIFVTTDAPGHAWLVSPGDALEVVGFWVLAAELVL